MRTVLGLLFLLALLAGPPLIVLYLLLDDREYRRRVLEREAAVRMIASINDCPDELEAS